MNDFKSNEMEHYRCRIMMPLGLVTNIKQYFKEKAENTTNYKKLEDLVWYMKKHVNDYPRFKALLWTLESRGIEGKYYGVSSEEDLKEQAKIINMFLELAYWNQA